MLSFNVIRVHVLYESLFRTGPYGSHLLSQSYSELKYKVYDCATSITLKFLVCLLMVYHSNSKKQIGNLNRFQPISLYSPSNVQLEANLQFGLNFLIFKFTYNPRNLPQNSRAMKNLRRNITSVGIQPQKNDDIHTAAV